LAKTAAGSRPVSFSRWRIEARARASPRARATVVELVGADRPKLDISDSGMGAGSTKPLMLVESSWQADVVVCAVMTTVGIDGGRCGVTARSSVVLPEKVMKSIMSYCEWVFVSVCLSFGGEQEEEEEMETYWFDET